MNYLEKKQQDAMLFVKKSRKKNKLLSFSVLLIILAKLYIIFLFFVPVFLVEEVDIEIENGYSLSETSDILHEKGIVRSSFFFKLYAHLSNHVIKHGKYNFEKGAYSLFNISSRFHNGWFGENQVRVTLPEGLSRSRIADILIDKKIPIEKETFLVNSIDKEGYLFPDTYYFNINDDENDIIDILYKNFLTQTENIRAEAKKKNINFDELVILASIIQKEASNDIDEMKIVSGILQKRIAMGIRLQVDAPFLYIQDKTSAELSIADLRKDGPYNTYTNYGLTPGAISNPGLKALRAALHPTDSMYLFYLHGKNGIIRYAKTHDEHVENKNAYLK